jgi:hypothetical protein
MAIRQFVQGDGFSRVAFGTFERYGPFRTYEEAEQVWRGRMGQNIDICEHRLWVTEIADLTETAEAPPGTRWAGGRYVPHDGSVSVCDKCGAEWPSAPLGTIHKCQCSGGYCHPKVVN